MILADTIGYIGMLIIVAAYGVAVFGKMKVSDPIYLFLSGMGGICLIYNAWFHGAWPLLILNVIFAIIAFIGLWMNRKEIK